MASQPGMTHMGPQTMFNVEGVKWSWLMTLGVIMVILGTLAIIFPAATSVSVEVILGILLVVAGISRGISMFRSHSWGDFFLKLLATVVYLAAGILLLVYPLGGTVTLTLILGIFFVAQGLVNVVISLASYGTKGWGWMLFSGIVSFALGALIWAELPSSAVWAIGLLVGIWLIIDGWAMIMMAWMVHSDENKLAAA